VDGDRLAELAADRPAGGAISPDGTILAVAAEGGLRLWRTADWSPVSEVPGPFLSVAFAPAGRTLLAGAGDGSLHFFCLDN
jgi:WD40 repeat protein